MSSNKISVVFPGQGSQYPQMLSQYIENLSIVRSTFEESSELLGIDLIKLLHEGSKEDLSKTEITQPLMLTADIALWNQISQFISLPICLAGHSLGEYAALVASETISFKDALALVIERSKFMQSAVPDGEGGIAAVIGLKEDEINKVCIEVNQDKKCLVNIANLNSQNQIVLSGNKQGILRAIDKCKLLGAKKAIPLPMSVPAHSMLMKEAADKFENTIKDIEFTTPRIPIIHNVDSSFENDIAKVKSKLVKQIYSSVRWVDTIKTITSLNVTTIIECGPSKVLCGLIKRIAPSVVTIDLDTYDNYLKLSNE
jgi:[acyl-carrier-protein] S-malonyltransferase